VTLKGQVRDTDTFEAK